MKSRSSLGETIKETAWRQIAQMGASSLSLRAIARELEITAPAIYNYFHDRNALVTDLMLDAFQSLADSQNQSIIAIPEDETTARLEALGLAYRDWALRYPQRYLLIFGAPIAGYQPPEATTNPPAAWAMAPLIDTIQSISDDQRLRLHELPPMSSELKTMLEAWRLFMNGRPDVEVLFLAISIWSRVHGFVMLEIGGQLPPFLTQPEEFFTRELKTILAQYLTD